MTQDRTFETLRRTQLEKMHKLWCDSPIPGTRDKDNPPTVIVEFFAPHGWIFGDFIDTWNKKYNNGPVRHI